MFKNNTKDEAVSPEAMNSNNIVGKGSTFNGNIQTYGNMRVEGKIIGDIISKSKVVVGPSAVIEGSVLANIAEIEGEVTGSVEVTDQLILKPTSVVSGDITAKKLVVESGAKFEGKCRMGDNVPKKKIELGGANSPVKKAM